MGCLRTAPSTIVSWVGARSTRCHASEREGEERWSPVVRCTATVPLGVRSSGGVSVADGNAFMNGTQAAEAVVIARKSRRGLFCVVLFKFNRFLVWLFGYITTPSFLLHPPRRETTSPPHT